MAKQVFCRAQRLLNQNRNHWDFLWLKHFIQTYPQTKYDKKPLFSPETTNQFDLLIKHPQSTFESIGLGFIYQCVAMPMEEVMAVQSLKDVGQNVKLQCVSIQKLLRTAKHPEYHAFGILMGYGFWAYDDLSKNQYMHSKIGGLNFKLQCPRYYMFENDTEIETPMNSDDQIKLFRIEEAVQMNKILALLYIINVYVPEFDDDGNPWILFGDAEDDEEEDSDLDPQPSYESIYDFECLLFHSAKRHYQSYLKRHYVYRPATNEESKEMELDASETENEEDTQLFDYFTENGAIHSILHKFSYLDLYFCMKQVASLTLLYIIYLLDFANWNKWLSAIRDACSSMHAHLVETLHGVSSYVLSSKQKLSIENIENYPLFIKNNLVLFVDYLHTAYPEVYRLVFDMVMNSPQFKITHLMSNGKKRQSDMFDAKVASISQKLAVMTDHIPQTQNNGENIRMPPQTHNRANLNHNHNHNRSQPRTTSLARHIDAEDKKKKKKRQKEMNLMKNAHKNKQKKSKKKKKYRYIKDVVKDCGIYDVIEEMKSIGYHKRHAWKANKRVAITGDNEDEMIIQEIQRVYADDDMNDEVINANDA